MWTNDELITDLDELAALHAERGVVALDMETAAIAHACEQRGVPWSVFRAISDRSSDGSRRRRGVRAEQPRQHAQPRGDRRVLREAPRSRGEAPEDGLPTRRSPPRPPPRPPSPPSRTSEFTRTTHTDRLPQHRCQVRCRDDDAGSRSRSSPRSALLAVPTAASALPHTAVPEGHPTSGTDARASAHDRRARRACRAPRSRAPRAASLRLIARRRRPIGRRGARRRVGRASRRSRRHRPATSRRPRALVRRPQSSDFSSPLNPTAAPRGGGRRLPCRSPPCPTCAPRRQQRSRPSTASACCAGPPTTAYAPSWPTRGMPCILLVARGRGAARGVGRPRGLDPPAPRPRRAPATRPDPAPARPRDRTAVVRRRRPAARRRPLARSAAGPACGRRGARRPFRRGGLRRRAREGVPGDRREPARVGAEDDDRAGAPTTR